MRFNFPQKRKLRIKDFFQSLKNSDSFNQILSQAKIENNRKVFFYFIKL